MNLPASNRSTTFQNAGERIYSHCDSFVPLRPHVEDWVTELIHARELLELLDVFDSPLNIHYLPQFEANVLSFTRHLQTIPLQSNIFFARKANKCLAYIHAARRLGLGVDVASEQELDECCNAGYRGDQMICTAAMKPSSLLRRCLQTRVPIVIDSVDEFIALTHILNQTPSSGRKHKILLRLMPNSVAFAEAISSSVAQTSLPWLSHSKFGLTKSEIQWIVQEIVLDKAPVEIIGTHFHLESSDIDAHAWMIREALATNSLLQQAGFPARIIDAGGGIPVDVHEDTQSLTQFLLAYQQAQAGTGELLTYQNRAYAQLGCRDGNLPLLNVYPNSSNECTGVSWLQRLLETRLDGVTLVELLSRHSVVLNFELGRSLLNNSGVTVARVNFRKPIDERNWAIGLEMNPTQWKTTHDDMLVDPILIPNHKSRTQEPKSLYSSAQVRCGILVGSCCAEDNLISPRLFSFPQGVAVGDLILFPNTSPYRMHFHESRLHRQNFAKNLILSATHSWSYTLDRGDA